MDTLCQFILHLHYFFPVRVLKLWFHCDWLSTLPCDFVPKALGKVHLPAIYVTFSHCVFFIHIAATDNTLKKQQTTDKRAEEHELLGDQPGGCARVNYRGSAWFVPSWWASSQRFCRCGFAFKTILTVRTLHGRASGRPASAHVPTAHLEPNDILRQLHESDQLLPARSARKKVHDNFFGNICVCVCVRFSEFVKVCVLTNKKQNPLARPKNFWKFSKKFCLELCTYPMFFFLACFIFINTYALTY